MSRALLRTAVALALACSACPVLAQPAAPPPVFDATTQIFCKGDSGELELMQFASLGTVMRRYQSRFNFVMSVQPGPPMTLMFSNPAESPYFISYDARPYRDEVGRMGVALLSMHVSLENSDQTITGTPMCFFTQVGH